MDHPVKICVVLVALFFACMGVAWVFSSAMEAQAFNQITGKNVSTWTAMWIELRVMEPTR